MPSPPSASRLVPPSPALNESPPPGSILVRVNRPRVGKDGVPILPREKSFSNQSSSLCSHSGSRLECANGQFQSLQISNLTDRSYTYLQKKKKKVMREEKKFVQPVHSRTPGTNSRLTICTKIITRSFPSFARFVTRALARLMCQYQLVLDLEWRQLVVIYLCFATETCGFGSTRAFFGAPSSLSPFQVPSTL